MRFGSVRFSLVHFGCMRGQNHYVSLRFNVAYADIKKILRISMIIPIITNHTAASLCGAPLSAAVVFVQLSFLSLFLRVMVGVLNFVLLCCYRRGVFISSHYLTYVCPFPGDFDEICLHESFECGHVVRLSHFVKPA